MIILEEICILNIILNSQKEYNKINYMNFWISLNDYLIISIDNKLCNLLFLINLKNLFYLNKIKYIYFFNYTTINKNNFKFNIKFFILLKIIYIK